MYRYREGVRGDDLYPRQLRNVDELGKIILTLLHLIYEFCFVFTVNDFILKELHSQRIHFSRYCYYFP